MKVNCPVCEKEKDVENGKFICSNCNSEFEYDNGKIVIIKRRKFDFWTFIMSIIFPVTFIVLFVNNTARNNFYVDNELVAGIIMIIYPLLIVLRQIFHLGMENYLFLNLYTSFVSKQLKKEDLGRILAFYLTFITNIVGLALIIKYIIT